MTDTTRRQVFASAGFAWLGASLTSSSRAAEDSPSAPGQHFNVRGYHQNMNMWAYPAALAGGDFAVANQSAWAG